jgi:diadenosine tetraphosphate (Ap4A) HIT family hydrolase
MCEQCKLLASGTHVAEEGAISVFIAPTSAPSVILIPKQHGPLSEQHDSAQEKILQVANTISSVLFDRLQLAGTNIIGHDGEHAYFQIVGRTEEDELDLRWTPKRASPEELENYRKRISEETWYIGKTETKKTEGKIEITRPSTPARPVQETPMNLPPEAEETAANRKVAKEIQDAVKAGPKSKRENENEHNYLIRQLTRRR